MPWLMTQTEKYVAEMGSHCEYPTTLIGNYVQEKQDYHVQQVKAYAKKIEARRAAE